MTDSSVNNNSYNNILAKLGWPINNEYIALNNVLQQNAGHCLWVQNNFKILFLIIIRVQHM